MDTENQSVTKEDIHLLLEHIMARIINEDRLSSERTNMFLVANSILLASFIASLSLSFAQGKLLAFFLAILGVFLSILQFLLMYFNFRVLSEWSKIRHNLEAHSSFELFQSQGLYPQKTYSDLVSKDPVIRWVTKFKLDPHCISKLWLPGCFFVLWIVFLLINFISC